MKKVINFLLKHKIFVVTIIILIYGLLLRIKIPYSMPIHENNHWIFFINWLLDYNFNIKHIAEKFIFIKEEFIEQMNYWLIPELIYWFLITKLWFWYKIIFVIQSLLNVLTVMFLSLIVYKISLKKFLYYSTLVIWIVLPYNIKFASTDEFLIMWNFFVAVSLYLYVLFLKKENYIYFFSSIFFYTVALYTRNLYLILIVFYILWFLYYLLNKKYNYKKLIINFLIWIGIFLFLILSRIKVFLFTKDSNYNASSYDLSSFHWFFPSMLTPNIYIILFLLWIILPIYFFINYKKKYTKIIFYYSFIIILLTLIFLLLFSSDNLLLQERLQNIFIPFFIVVSSLWFFFLTKKIKYHYFILPLFLLLPFLYIDNIKYLYSPQEDYLFLESNIKKLWENPNLVILWFSDSSVFNNFPIFLIANKQYSIYWMGNWDPRYTNFNYSYDNLKQDNNYFILSYDCYRWNNIWKQMRVECEYVEENYNLETVAEKYIENRPYIFNNNSKKDMLKIWVYKVISKK